MVRIQWFGYVLDTSWAVLVGVALAIFLICAGIAWALGKAAKLRAGALTTSLGGGAILFFLILAGALSAIYHTLSAG